MENHPPWQELFPGARPEEQSVLVPMRLLKKRGEPLLLLPQLRSCAATSLALYPAQTKFARTAKTVLQRMILMGFTCGLKEVELKISRENALLKFLGWFTDATLAPQFAILAGNPKTAGRRFIILVFDSGAKPIEIVKVGVGDVAKNLIDKEISFLGNVPAGTLGIPVLRKSLKLPEVRALALDFAPGQSPNLSEDASMFPLLTAWLNPATLLPVSEFPLWQRLKSKTTSSLVAILEQRITHPIRMSLYHGDFAPWNIKSDGGRWTVIDWERGESSGLPGWDCFHFIMQRALLVHRCSTLRLIEIIDSLFQDKYFAAYAKSARILGIERELLLAYLLYQINVIQPSEGKRAMEEALTTLASKWLGVEELSSQAMR